MDQKTYEEHEARILGKQLIGVEEAPLGERKEARQAWREALETPGLVAERMRWLINGSYGFGAYRMAGRILAHPRSNRVAALSILVAGMEWQCPGAFARAAWKTLPEGRKNALKAELQAVIRDADTETAAE